MRRTVARLSDGRELIYFDDESAPRRVARDQRALAPGGAGRGTMRHDPLTDQWVTVAGHRQSRIHLPVAALCPLCPSSSGHLSEIPESDYQVAVFENRFPSFQFADAGIELLGDPLWNAEVPAHGRCEVVAYTADHDGSAASLDADRMRLVMSAWIDRVRELSALPGIRYVFVFENRGADVGVTLHHPHGQIYAYPFVPDAVVSLLRTAQTHRVRSDTSLLDAVVDRELEDGRRIIVVNEHWVAFVPFAARWPYEVQIHPIAHRLSLDALTDSEQASFAELFPRLVRALDSLFDTPFPYMAGWTQAPAHASIEELADSRLFLKLISNRRAADKLKYLASSESLMGAFVNDISPEDAAEEIRRAWSATQ